MHLIYIKVSLKSWYVTVMQESFTSSLNDFSRTFFDENVDSLHLVSVKTLIPEVATGSRCSLNWSGCTSCDLPRNTTLHVTTNRPEKHWQKYVSFRSQLAPVSHDTLDSILGQVRESNHVGSSFTSAPADHHLSVSNCVTGGCSRWPRQGYLGLAKESHVSAQEWSLVRAWTTDPARSMLSILPASYQNHTSLLISSTSWVHFEPQCDATGSVKQKQGFQETAFKLPDEWRSPISKNTSVLKAQSSWPYAIWFSFLFTPDIDSFERLSSVSVLEVKFIWNSGEYLSAVSFAVSECRREMFFTRSSPAVYNKLHVSVTVFRIS